MGFVAIEQVIAKQTSWIGDLQVKLRLFPKDSSHHVVMHCLQEIPNNVARQALGCSYLGKCRLHYQIAPQALATSMCKG